MNTENVIEVVTDHFQLLFGDEAEAPRVDTSMLWDNPGRVVTLSDFPALVGLGTVRYGGTTRLTIRTADYQETPTPDWQIMGSFEINVPSGRLIFWAPELEDLDRAPIIELPPGHYQGRAFIRGSEELHDEMASDGPDEYLIVLSSG